MPYHIAMELLLTGRWMDAEEAHRWGLVNEVLAADKLLGRAWESAQWRALRVTKVRLLVAATAAICPSA